MSSSFTGLNVPSPTCSVTNPIFIPFSLIFFKSSGVKCSPAVGAAAEPRSFAYTVWYLFLSFNFSFMYGGSGICPIESSLSKKFVTASNFIILFPSGRISLISASKKTLSLSPNKNLNPGFAFLPGFTKVSQIPV